MTNIIPCIQSENGAKIKLYFSYVLHMFHIQNHLKHRVYWSPEGIPSCEQVEDRETNKLFLVLGEMQERVRDLLTTQTLWYSVFGDVWVVTFENTNNEFQTDLKKVLEWIYKNISSDVFLDRLSLQIRSLQSSRDQNHRLQALFLEVIEKIYRLMRMQNTKDTWRVREGALENFDKNRGKLLQELTLACNRYDSALEEQKKGRPASGFFWK